ncbi:uncharacterized protein TNCV_2842031 [Trichonephila clavipes]|uniref:Uncharacterized protein n=1 Tax=Trichonephila clavipes TaxID=2585209 RepID=A0A8X6RMK3_TRICX|nr:uncharacterized protein TNCV_2842031 [Trichonephila clavipes]
MSQTRGQLCPIVCSSPGVTKIHHVERLNHVKSVETQRETFVPVQISNPREGTDVCKCIVPLRHGGTLNSCRAASSLGRFMEGEERWEALDDLQGVFPQNWGGIEPNRTDT